MAAAAAGILGSRQMAVTSASLQLSPGQQAGLVAQPAGLLFGSSQLVGASPVGFCRTGSASAAAPSTSPRRQLAVRAMAPPKPSGKAKKEGTAAPTAGGGGMALPSQAQTNATVGSNETRGGSPGGTAADVDVEEVTKKWGLEAGLWKALTAKSDAALPSSQPAAQREDQDSSSSSSGGGGGGSKSNTEVAKELLAKYGGAYLATSITFAIMSFSLCYVLVNRGVDVAGLLSQVGINVDETGEKVGTLAIAYAAHKAASPIRFPPTVILTPIVADFLSRGKKEKQEKT